MNTGKFNSESEEDQNKLSTSQNATSKIISVEESDKEYYWYDLDSKFYGPFDTHAEAFTAACEYMNGSKIFRAHFQIIVWSSGKTTIWPYYKHVGTIHLTGD